MPIKIGHSQYIAKGQLEKLNRPVLKTNYINNLNKILHEALMMIEDGTYLPEKLARKFPGKPYLKRADFTQPFHLYSTIETDIYFHLQSILFDLTGRFWEMDVFMDLLIGWFVYAYQNKLRKPKKLPFYRKERLKGNRYKLLRKFNKSFSPFYKNIMGEWK